MKSEHNVLRLLNEEFQRYNGGRYSLPLEDEEELQRMSELVNNWLSGEIEEFAKMVFKMPPKSEDDKIC